MRQFHYQTLGSEFLASRQYACLFDEQGLGKTNQALIAIQQINAKTVVVVCRAVVRTVWQREIEKWGGVANICHTGAGKPRSGVINIISYEGMGKFKDSILALGKIDVLLADECQDLKNSKAKRTKNFYGAYRVIGHLSIAERVWLLSGSPVPNNTS